MPTCRCDILTFVMGVTLLGGCAAYVNIPAQLGDLAGHNPNDATVRMVLGEALRGVLLEHPFDGTFAILLPERTTSKTYDAVASKVSKLAVWPGSRDRTDLPLLEVKQILVRGQSARVDVIRQLDGTQPEPREQLVTVDLHWHPLKGWLVQRLQGWRLSVQDALAVHADEEP